uniref:Secreted protein n=1 Tax=Ixodes ricinus TaxID=34613 RepID=A0A6B0V4F2_IXORI
MLKRLRLLMPAHVLRLVIHVVVVLGGKEHFVARWPPGTVIVHDNWCASLLPLLENGLHGGIACGSPVLALAGVVDLARLPFCFQLKAHLRHGPAVRARALLARGRQRRHALLPGVRLGVDGQFLYLLHHLVRHGLRVVTGSVLGGLVRRNRDQVFASHDDPAEHLGKVEQPAGPQVARVRLAEDGAAVVEVQFPVGFLKRKEALQVPVLGQGDFHELLFCKVDGKDSD